MTTAIGSETGLAAARSDLDALKDDVGSSIEHLEGGARNGVHAADVRGLSHGAAAEEERSAKAIGAWAEAQPLFVADPCDHIFPNESA